MKRVRILFSALAVVLAAGSAFSTVEDRRAIVYYQSTTPGATCDVQFNSEEVCKAGNDDQCRIDRPDPMPDLYISKRVDGGVCEEHWRQAQ